MPSTPTDDFKDAARSSAITALLRGLHQDTLRAIAKESEFPETLEVLAKDEDSCVRWNARDAIRDRKAAQAAPSIAPAPHSPGPAMP